MPSSQKRAKLVEDKAEITVEELTVNLNLLRCATERIAELRDENQSLREEQKCANTKDQESQALIESLRTEV